MLVIRSPSVAMLSTPKIRPPASPTIAGAPLSMAGVHTRSAGALPAMPRKKRATFSAPDTIFNAAITLPPPSLTIRASVASSAVMPARSPAASALPKRVIRSTSARGATAKRVRSSAMWRRARDTYCRHAGSDTPSAAATSS